MIVPAAKKIRRQSDSALELQLHASALRTDPMAAMLCRVLLKAWMAWMCICSACNAMRCVKLTCMMDTDLIPFSSVSDGLNLDVLFNEVITCSMSLACFSASHL